MKESRARIYLDYNASAPVLPEVAAVVERVLRMPGNPSSIHRDGRRIRGLLDQARDSVGNLVQARPEAITFTSGGTEANNAVVMGLLRTGVVRRVLCSEIEHPSLLEHTQIDNRIRVRENGIVDLTHLERELKLSTGPVLVCVMFANNETGIIQPIGDVCEITHKYDGLVLCDAVQAPGKVSLNVEDTGADFLTLSAHKIGGPQGVGALVNNSTIELGPILIGGGQERRKRSGTENSSGIVGFGTAALSIVDACGEANLAHLQERFETALLQADPDALIIGMDVTRLPNTTCLVKPGYPAEQQVINLDLAGFSVSAGSACSSGKVAESHVLKAMGLGEDLANSAIRVSFGHETCWSDLEKFVSKWKSL